MQRAIVTVQYRLSGSPARFRADMERAAASIAGIPGLIWKIWGLDQERRAGVSAYLFESTDAADDFAAGPVLDRLRGHRDVAEVTMDLAAVDHGLSARTGAEFALASRPAATEPRRTVGQTEAAAS